MPKVTAVEGPQRGVSFDVHAGASIGRGRSCAVRLEGRHISRVHARFEPRGEQLAIVDADSRNGVFVNGQKVKEQVLKKDDEIEIGEHVLIFDPTVPAAAAGQAPSAPQAQPAQAPAAGGKPGEKPTETTKPSEPPRPRPAAGTSVLDSLVNPLADVGPDHLQAITEASRQLTLIDDDKDLAQALLTRIMEATKARRGFVMITDDRGRMKPLAKAMPEGDAEFYVSNVLYHQVHKERRAILATDVARSGANAGKPISILSAPLIVGDSYLGFAYLDGPADGTPPAPCFTRTHLQYAAGLCALAAPLLATARRASKARHNARAIIKRLDAESPIVTAGGLMKEVVDKIEPLALAEAPVLVLGERGTGRELVARALHLRSPRGAHPFVVIDIGVLPPDAAETTLFGSGSTPGVLEATRNGAVCLAEIGELSAELQTRLQKVLEERAARTGTGAPPEARVIASSSHDLEARAKEGKFRGELLARFPTVLRLPPLRERKGDIAPLVAHFLKVLGGRQSASPQDHITGDALAFLEAYPWPGNVRELRNAVERMLISAGPKKLGPEHIPADLVCSDILTRVRRLVKGDLPLTTLMAELEKACLEEALRRTGGNKAAAAEFLGVSRPTLLEKLKVYGLTPEEHTATTKPA